MLSVKTFSYPGIWLPVIQSHFSRWDFTFGTSGVE